MSEESAERGDPADLKEEEELSGEETDTQDQDHDDDSGQSSSEDDEEEDEPKLKYARLTGHLGAVYRNGDATSTFLVTGDKMVGFAHLHLLK